MASAAAGGTTLYSTLGVLGKASTTQLIAMAVSAGALTWLAVDTSQRHTNNGQSSSSSTSSSSASPVSPDPDDNDDKNNKQQAPNKEYSKHSERFKNQNRADVEKDLDRELLQKGWTKKPLKNGSGWRYFDGRGNSISINDGDPNSPKPGDAIHKNPYLKIEPGGIRVPLK